MGFIPWLLCRPVSICILIILVNVLCALANASLYQKHNNLDNWLNRGYKHNHNKHSNSLLLISLDGFRPEYLERGYTPTLAKLANDGIMAESMKPQFPSLTFPNHYCIATGLYPVNHGIVHNRFYDTLLQKTFSYTDESENNPEWWLGEPIWNTVQKYGKKSACMFWPGSNVEILGKVPTYSFKYDGNVSSKERIDQIIYWLLLPPKERPSFLTLYFSMVDTAGHRYGPDSQQLNDALIEVDAAINYLLYQLKRIGLLNKINIVIVSDHGMISTCTDTPHSISIDSLIDVKDLEWYETGVVCTMIPRRIDDVFSFYMLLKSTPDYLSNKFDIYLREELPKELNYSTSSRIPPLILIAKKGFSFTSSFKQRLHPTCLLKGNHGYPADDTDKDIHAIFIAHGPKFPKNTQSFTQSQNRIPTFSNLELFQLFTIVLDIPIEKRDGQGKLVDFLYSN